MAKVINDSFKNIKDSTIINVEKEKIPQQLTSKLSIYSNFIGRESELETIEEKLNSSNSLLLINGIGGVGKSAIASYYLSLHKEQFDYYGFFEGIESFTTELKPRLNLQATKEDELFMEALAKLSGLEGEKLLVIDNVKEIENNQETINKILGLKESGYKILLTSRESIENTPHYALNVMNLEDAKKLFNSIYEVEDEKLLEEILGYLDCHTLFIEMTAKTLTNKQTLTPQKLKEMFESGAFTKVSIKRKQSFNDYLTKLFNSNK